MIRRGDPAALREPAGGVCPLCGDNNRCGVVAGAYSTTPCWCRNVGVPWTLMAAQPEYALPPNLRTVFHPRHRWPGKP